MKEMGAFAVTNRKNSSTLVNRSTVGRSGGEFLVVPIGKARSKDHDIEETHYVLEICV
jgi:hypothetical protein